METSSDNELILRLDDRRSSLSKPSRIQLYPDRLEHYEADTLIRRIPLSAVKQVRLSVEMAGQDTQVVCRVVGQGGQIVVGSRAYQSPGNWSNNAINYRTFVLKLHELLQSMDQDIRYIEGQSLSFRIILSLLGLAIAGLAGFFAWFMWTEKNSSMLALAGLPGILVGLYLMWVFRPAIPLPYDPDGLIERFRQSEETRSDAS